MIYYLKKCGFQELGSVEQNGKINRGRYLLTSKNENVMKFFPPLSVTQKNDSALLPIIPLYLKEKVYCNYVYHNDKFHGSTAKTPRNEYRIYLNKKLEKDGLLFSVDDILLFRREELKINGEVQIVYFLEHINNKKSNLYKVCNDYIKKSNINGGYAICDTIFTEIEEKITAYKEQGQTNIVIDDTVTRRVQNENQESISKLFNSTTFRDFVMVGYNNICAITKSVIKYNTFTNLEAAHIKPKSHGGLFLPNNGIALSRDFHWAFDKGFFTIDDDMRIKVHDKVESEYLHSFNNKEIYIPRDLFFAPDIRNIKYHQDNVYGLFLITGKL